MIPLYQLYTSVYTAFTAYTEGRDPMTKYFSVLRKTERVAQKIVPLQPTPKQAAELAFRLVWVHKK